MADAEDSPLDPYIESCRKKVRTILHGAIVIILFFVIMFAYLYLYRDVYFRSYDDSYATASLLTEAVAYLAVGCLCNCNCSGRREQIIVNGFLVVVVLVSLSLGRLSDDKYVQVHLAFWANIAALSSYCVYKLLYPPLLAWLRRCLLLAAAYPAAAQQDIEAAGAVVLRGRRLTAAPAAVEAPSEPAAPRQREQEAALRLAAQTTFRIQDLPREFSVDEIRAMTQDFGSMVGQGGFAQVFRGDLDDGTAVAVKRIRTMTSDQDPVAVAGDENFRREVAVIANVNHRSLVRLLGYCVPPRGDTDIYRYLVYPFFDNGSLDACLFHGGDGDGDQRRRLLTWPKRYCIALDVAKALAYLHHGCRRRILHLDVKPGNILLDGDLRAHVSDFGISMSVTRNLSHLTSVVDTRGRGTFGYMASEMLFRAVSDKSDVFSYGMTVLELIGGRRNFCPSSTDAASSSRTPDLARDYFPSIVREKMARGQLMEAVDAAMPRPLDEEAVEKVVKVALCCIQHRRDMRPDMQTVVDMLNGRLVADLPPESTPSSALNYVSEPLSSPLTDGR